VEYPYLSKIDERHGLNSANEKLLIHCQTVEFAHFILPEMRTNQDIRHSFWRELGVTKRFEYD
jgi:hypothetical protein